MQLPPAAAREQKEAKHAVKIIQRGEKAGAVSSIATRGSVIKDVAGASFFLKEVQYLNWQSGTLWITTPISPRKPMEEYYRYCSPDHVGNGRKGF